MTKKLIQLVAVTLILTITIQANENQMKRGFTVTTIALDAQVQEESARLDTNETNIEGGASEEK